MSVPPGVGPDRTRAPLTVLRDRWTGITFWQRRLLVGGFLLFDAYLGMIYGAGVIGWSGLITGDMKWLTLALELSLIHI